METYTLDPAVFDTLAAGQADEGAARLLAESQRSARMLLIMAAAERRPQLEPALELLLHLEHKDPAAASDVFGHPFLGAWFAAPHGHEEYLGGLVAGAAAAAGLSFALTVPVRAAGLTLPGVGRAATGPGEVRIAGDGHGLTFGAGGRKLRVDPPLTAPAPGWSPMHQHTARAGGLAWRFRIDDADPHRDRFDGAVTRLAPVARDRLATALRQAWQLLARQQPVAAAALAATVSTIVPVRPQDAGRDHSASARDAHGAVAVSVVADPVRLAELLLHEHQHLVLGALLDLVPLCRPNGPAVYHAPWRPDARPAGPLLQGIYAQIGVAAFWRARQADYWYAYRRAQVAGALEAMVAGGELTDAGIRFAAGLRRTVDAWSGEPVAARAGRLADLAMLADRVAWRLANQAPEPATADALAAALRSGAACPPLAEPSLVPVGIAPRGRLAVLGEGWEDPPPTADPGVTALLAGAYAEAAAAFDDGAGTDWPGLAVAAAAGELPGGRLAEAQPALLRAVTTRVRAAGLPVPALRVAEWLESFR